ncbi:MAG: hypothetical protein V4701_06355 [Pseudomonadota bacterium]
MGEGPCSTQSITDLIDDDPETELVLQPSQGEVLAWLYEHGRVTARDTDEEGRMRLTVRLDRQAIGRFERQPG